jgi:hypothetical protein
MHAHVLCAGPYAGVPPFAPAWIIRQHQLRSRLAWRPARTFMQRRCGGQRLSSDGQGSYTETLLLVLDLTPLKPLSDTRDDHQAAVLAGGLNPPVLIDKDAVEELRNAVHKQIPERE